MSFAQNSYSITHFCALLLLAASLNSNAQTLRLMSPPLTLQQHTDPKLQPDSCARVTAASILSSKLPFPSIRKFSGALVEQDLWAASTRLRYRPPPGGWSLGNEGFLPDSHPLSGNTLNGWVGGVLGYKHQDPLPPARAVALSRGLSGRFTCAPTRNNLTIKLKAATKKKLVNAVVELIKQAHPSYADSVTVAENNKLRMTAIAYDGPYDQRGVFYIPYSAQDMVDLTTGQYQGIDCAQNESAASPRSQLQCSFLVWVSPDAVVWMQAPLTTLPELPKVHKALALYLKSLGAVRVKY